VIRNLKSKLKVMSSSSPLHSQNNELTSSPINESGSTLLDTENLEYIEVVRRGSISHANDMRARGDFGGKVIEGPDGAFVRKRTIYGEDSTYGKIEFSRLFASDYTNSNWWTRLDKNFNIQDIVFLDTETTGLAGGTGTYAFLIGLGYIDDQGLVVEQYLMRDFDEEYPMLKAVMETLKKFRVLITFNGKSFDWPLLESRLIYSRLGTIHWEDTHLDLLHLSRRLWRKRLESCSLSCIEKNILSHIRKDDIPGSLIPDIYFEYLESRDIDMMNRVMLHNQWDIAAMAALLLHVKNLYEDPVGRGDAYELLGIARELERNQRIEDAASCYQRCIHISNKHSLTIEAKKRLAYLKKRYEGPKEAMNIWADLANEDGNLLIFPLIEMAKYLEHGKKDFQKALTYTERAILLADTRSKDSSKLKEELLHRRRRLIRKLGRNIKSI
jgi:uncharacterized protein YprB with RNaseH-like and TPR domain